MLVTYMPNFAYGDTINAEEGDINVIASATSPRPRRVRLNWLEVEGANLYTIYGNISGKRLRKIGETSNLRYVVKRIRGKRLKTKKVYNFYVVASKRTGTNSGNFDVKNLGRSKTCTIIVGKTMKFFKHGSIYSNPRAVSVKNSTLKLEPGEVASLQSLTGVSTKMYRNKKHLTRRFGKRYTYISKDESVGSVNGKYIRIAENAEVGTSAQVIVQEINGAYETVNVKVVTSTSDDAVSDKDGDNTGDTGGGGGGGGGQTGIDLNELKQEVKAKISAEATKTKKLFDNVVISAESSYAENAIKSITGKIDAIVSSANAAIDPATNQGEVLNANNLAMYKLGAIQELIDKAGKKLTEELIDVLNNAFDEINKAGSNDEVKDIKDDAEEQIKEIRERIESRLPEIKDEAKELVRKVAGNPKAWEHPLIDWVASADANIDKAEDEVEVAEVRDYFIDMILEKILGSDNLEDIIKAAKDIIRETIGDTPSQEILNLAISSEAAIDNAGTRDEIKEIVEQFLTKYEEIRARELENELIGSKENAKRLLDRLASGDASAEALAIDGKKEIDDATTEQEVQETLREWVEKIAEVIEKHSSGDARRRFKDALDNLAAENADVPGVQKIVDDAKDDIDKAKDLIAAVDIFDSAVNDINKLVKDYKEKQEEEKRKEQEKLLNKLKEEAKELLNTVAGNPKEGPLYDLVKEGSAAIDKARTETDVIYQKNLYVNKILAEIAKSEDTSLDDLKSIAIATINAAAGDDPSVAVLELVASAESAICAATTKERVQEIVSEFLDELARILIEGSSNELNSVKEAAKAVIDKVSEGDASAEALAIEAKAAIDNAGSKEEVQKVLAEWIDKITRVIEKTEGSANAKERLKDALEDLAYENRNVPGVGDVAEKAEDDIDNSDTIDEAIDIFNEAVEKINEEVAKYKEQQEKDNKDKKEKELDELRKAAKEVVAKVAESAPISAAIRALVNEANAAIDNATTESGIIYQRDYYIQKILAEIANSGDPSDLTALKAAAKETIKAAAGDFPSETVSELATSAISDVDAATTKDKIQEIVKKFLDDLQKVSLNATKERAKDVIDKIAADFISDEDIRILVQNAKTEIDKASNTQEVEQTLEKWVETISNKIVEKNTSDDAITSLINALDEIAEENYDVPGVYEIAKEAKKDITDAPDFDTAVDVFNKAIKEINALVKEYREKEEKEQQREKEEALAKLREAAKEVLYETAGEPSRLDEPLFSIVASGNAAIDASKTEEEITQTRNEYINKILDAMGDYGLDAVKDAAKHTIETAAGDKPSPAVANLILSAEAKVDEATSTSEVKEIVSNYLAELAELTKSEAENDLDAVKGRAKDVIDKVAAGASDNANVKELAARAKAEIDKASSKEKVEQLLEKWIARITDEMAKVATGDAVKENLKAALDKINNDYKDDADLKDIVDNIVVKAKTAIDKAETNSEAVEIFNQAIKEIETAISISKETDLELKKEKEAVLSELLELIKQTKEALSESGISGDANASITENINEISESMQKVIAETDLISVLREEKVINVAKLNAIQELIRAVGDELKEEAIEVATDACDDITKTNDSQRVEEILVAAIKRISKINDTDVYCFIELSANGGSNGLNEILVKYGTNIVVGGMIVPPTLPGSEFTGFYTKATGGTKLISADGSLAKSVEGYTDANGNWIRKDKVRLYAHWTNATYTIPLRAGGTGTDGSVTYVYGSSNYKGFKAATKPGFICIGYFTDYDSGDMILSADGTLASSDSTWEYTNIDRLYAHWQATNCIITLDPAGGELGLNRIVVNYETHRVEGGYSQNLIRPSKTGFDFEGLYNEEGQQVIPASYTTADAESAHLFVKNVTGYVQNYQWIKAGDTTLTAHWSPRLYKITLDRNGGIEDGQIAIRFNAAEKTNLSIVERRGYVCTGYYTSKGGGDLVLTSTGDLNNNYDVQNWIEDGKWISTNEKAKLYPHWTNNKKNVTLDANYTGGQNGEAQVGTDDTSLTITKPADVRTGWEFLGYFDGKDDGANLVASADGSFTKSVGDYTDAEGKWISSADGVKLYSHWKIKECNITVKDTEGGNSDFNLSIQCDTANILTEPGSITIPTRAGYKLAGLAVGSSDGDLALKAKTNAAGQVTGYELVEYCKDYVLNTKWIKTGSAILYAKWAQQTCKITFHDNNNENPDITEEYNFDENKFVNSNVEQRLPSSDGNTLLGFETTSSVRVFDITEAGLLKLVKNVPDIVENYKWIRKTDITLNAVWQPKESNITLVDPSGTNSEETYTINYGTGKFVGPEPSVPTRQGYKFQGYYTASEDGQKVVGISGESEFALNAGATDYVQDNKWIKSTDTTLYARWTAKEYSITLDKNGGDEDGSVVFAYGANTKTSIDAPTKSGYVVVGYYTGQSADSDKILNAQGNVATTGNISDWIENGTWAHDNANTKLYAIWKAQGQKVNLLATADGAVSGSAYVDFDSESLDIQTKPSRTGYTLTGFETLDGKIVADENGKFIGDTVDGYISGNKWSATGDAERDLYAVWKEKLSHITFKSDGTTKCEADINYETKEYKNPTVASYTPEKTGYTCEGFYTSQNGGELVLKMNAGVPEYSEVDVEGYVADGEWIRQKDATLHARWKANTYNVTLNANCPDGSAGAVEYDYDATKPNADTFVAATRTGYSCAGYYLTSACAGESVLTPDGKLADGAKWNYTELTELYAKWVVDGCTISFHVNGGDAGTGSNEAIINYTTGKFVSIDGDTNKQIVDSPTRTGYTFLGWSISQTFDIRVISADGKIVSEDVPGWVSNGKWIMKDNHILYAHWSADTYNLTLARNGGDATGSASIQYGDEIAVPFNKVTRSGHTCEGYYLEPTFETKVLDTYGNVVEGTWTRTEKNLTLYPKWEAKEYEIALKTSGDGAVDGLATVKYDATNMVISTEPLRPGYDLINYTILSGDTVAARNGNFEGRTIDGYIEDGHWIGLEDKELYAQWMMLHYTITFDPNGGTISENSRQVCFVTEKVDVPEPIFEGHTFEGWYDVSDNANPKRNLIIDTEGNVNLTGGKWNIASDVTLYAHWKTSEYTIELSANGGTSGTRLARVGYGDKSIPSIIAPYMKGHTFDGWYTPSADGTKVLSADGSFVNEDVPGYVKEGAWSGTSDKTLVAHWTANTNRIILDKNGGDKDGSANSSYGSNELSTFQRAERFNYDVIGYYTLETGGTKVLDAQGHFASDSIPGFVSGGKWIYEDDITLYAHWMAKGTNITLNKNGGSADGSATVSCDATSVNSINTPTKIGYTCTGYYLATDGNSKVISADGTLVSGNVSDLVAGGKWATSANAITLYAHWTANKYKITLKPNGGTGGTELTEATYEQSTLNTITAPTRDGYNFLGWYTTEDGLSRIITKEGNLVSYSVDGYTDAGKWIATEDKTLYAHWQKDMIGKLITFAGSDKVEIDEVTGPDSFRILDSEGTKAKLLAIKSKGTTKYNASSKTRTAGGYTFQNYSGSTLDTYLNTTYRNNLPSSVRDKIQKKAITQKVYWYGTVQREEDSGCTYYVNPNQYGKKIVLKIPCRYEAEVGDRYIYCPDLEDVAEYLDCDYIVWNDLSRMFYDRVVEQANKGSTWLRAAMLSPTGTTKYSNLTWNVDINVGGFDNFTVGSNSQARAMFTIDLDDLRYEINDDGTAKIITLNPNGGTGGTGSKKILSGSTGINVTLPTRTGYTFAGWYTAASDGKLVIDETGKVKTSDGKLNITSDMTLYAHWTANANTITFNANNGTDSKQTLSVTYGDSSASPTKPTMAGHTFAGWYSESVDGVKVLSADGNFVANEVPGFVKNGMWVRTDSTANLYAHWTPKTYKLTLENKQGTNGLATIKYDGSQATINYEPVRAGYTVEGYYTNDTNGSKLMNKDGTFAGDFAGIYENGKWIQDSDLTLYTQWQSNGTTLTLKCNDWETSDGEAIITREATAASITTQPVIEGYTVEGYYLEQTYDRKVLDKDFNVVSGNVDGYVTNGKWACRSNAATLYVRLMPESHIVVFDANGGTIDTPYAIATYGANTTTSIPTRTGYTFNGWFTETSGGAQVFNDDGTTKDVSGIVKNGKWSLLENKTLHAHWKASTYTITLNKNGGNGGTDSVQVTYTESYDKLVINNPKKVLNDGWDAYDVTGWYTSADGGTLALNADGTVVGDLAGYLTDGKWLHTENITLYAHWKLGFKVTFHANNSNIVAEDKVQYISREYGGNLMENPFCSSDTEVQFDKKPLGGRVFYIATAESNSTYSFYDKEGAAISGSATVSGLENAYYYSIKTSSALATWNTSADGTGLGDDGFIKNYQNKEFIKQQDDIDLFAQWDIDRTSGNNDPKFFIVATNEAGDDFWYEENVFLDVNDGYPYRNSSVYNGDKIGDGKRNTDNLSIENAARTSNSGGWYEHSPVLQRIIKARNTNELGNNDWFLPNKVEMRKLEDSEVLEDSEELKEKFKNKGMVVSGHGRYVFTSQIYNDNMARDCRVKGYFINGDKDTNDLVGSANQSTGYFMMRFI